MARPDRYEHQRDDEARGVALMREAAGALVVGVRESLGGWSEREVDRILDAWDQLGASARVEARRDARAAGEAAAFRVADALERLLALDAAQQRATPLEIVRSAYREPTAVLHALGVPPVVRDDFAERAWPDDVYGLAIRTLADLGRDDLGPLHLAWGVGKAKVITARMAR